MTELQVTEHTVWFTSFEVADGDGLAEAQLRVDYDGDLEMILREAAYRGRISEVNPMDGKLSFTTVWDSMDSGSLKQTIHNALQTMPPEIILQLRL